MNLNELVNGNFGLIDSSFSVFQARNVLNNVDQNYRIIISNADENEYYLHNRPDFLGMIEGVRGNIKISTLIHQQRPEAIKVFNAGEQVESVPAKAIVVIDRKVIGYVDLTEQPTLMTRPITRMPNPINVPARRVRTRSGSIKRAKVAKKNGGGTLVTPQKKIEATIGDEKLTFFLNAYYKEKAQMDQVISIRVNLAQVESGQTAIPLQIVPNSEVDILIEPKAGLKVIGSDQNTIKALDREESDSVIFKLQPTSIGKGKVRLMAFVDGTEIGHIDITIEISNEPVGDARNEKRTAEISNLSGSPLPDLTLLITESEENGKSNLMFRLTANEKLDLDLYLEPYGPVTFRLNPREYFKEMFDGIENLPDATSQAEILSRLEDKGLQLFKDLFPENLRNLIWSIRDKIKTLKIDSDEAWIPWEICKLTGKDGNRTVEGPFFCEAFEITRWIPGHGAPKSRINFNKMAIVVPKDSGLEHTNDEKNAIKDLLKKKNSVDEIPANYLTLSKALSTGQYSAWHFSGHGSLADIKNPQQTKMILEDDSEFTPEAINGEVENLGIAKPLVFFNACQIGNGAMGLTGVGGWASQLLKAGAASFIGAYWSISDDLAYNFAVSLYKQLLNGVKIGQAVKEARLSIKREGDPTWLAYTVYADPNASTSTP